MSKGERGVDRSYLLPFAVSKPLPTIVLNNFNGVKMWETILTAGRQAVSGTGLAEPISVSIVAAGEAVLFAIIIILGTVTNCG